MVKKLINKVLDKPIKYNGKSYTAKDLARKLRLKGDVELSTQKTWFSDAMEELDKEKK